MHSFCVDSHSFSKNLRNNEVGRIMVEVAVENVEKKYELFRYSHEKKCVYKFHILVCLVRPFSSSITIDDCLQFQFYHDATN